MNAVIPTTALDREIAAHQAAPDAGDAAAAWTALERAHILAQPTLRPHIRVHGLMLGYAVRLRQPREIAGQLARLALAPIGALTGRIPPGNSGRSDVSAFEPMPIPPDLATMMDEGQ